MNVADAQSAFVHFLSARFGTTPTPPPPLGLAAMLAFYREVRADGCDLAQDQDTLLFQWGTYDWGSGWHDEVAITRQLIAPQALDEDAAIWQLSLTYRVQGHTALVGVEPGDHWCHSPTDLASFESFILTSVPYVRLNSNAPWLPTLQYEQAG